MGLFRILFPKIPSEKDVKDSEEQIVKKMVMRYSRGEISLSKGNYITPEKHERRRIRSLKYDFT